MFFFSRLIRERGKGFAFQMLVKMAGLLLAHEALVKQRVGGDRTVNLRQRLLRFEEREGAVAPAFALALGLALAP